MGTVSARRLDNAERRSTNSTENENVNRLSSDGAEGCLPKGQQENSPYRKSMSRSEKAEGRSRATLCVGICAPAAFQFKKGYRGKFSGPGIPVGHAS
jgi:hypothetical protein